MGNGGRNDPPRKSSHSDSQTSRHRASSDSQSGGIKDASLRRGQSDNQPIEAVIAPSSPGPSTASRSQFCFPRPTTENPIECSSGHANLSYRRSLVLADGSNLARSVSQQQSNGRVAVAETSIDVRPPSRLSDLSRQSLGFGGKQRAGDLDERVSNNPRPSGEDNLTEDNRVLQQQGSIQATREASFGLVPYRSSSILFHPGGNDPKPPLRPKYERMHSGRLSVYIPEEEVEVDAIPNRRPYRLRDMLLTMWAIGTYIFDYVMDWVVAAGFYRDGDYNWFGLTVAFIVVPHLTMMCFSLAWYLQDRKHHPSDQLQSFNSKQWLIRMVVLVLQLAPVLRYVDSLRYGYRFRNSKRLSRLDLYESLCFENADAAMLRLFEAFMEAAPQLVLQIYILAVKRINYDKFDFLQVLQIVSIFTSWISLATAMATFHRAQRFSQHAKGSMSFAGTLMQFGWHLFIFESRVIAIALFTVRFPLWGPVVCTVHVLLMIVWVFTMRTEFCPNRWLEYLYNVAVGCLYLFAFLNVKDTPTRWKYLFYYGVYYAENVILITLWYTFTQDEEEHWFRKPALGAVVGGFWIGIFVFMIPYYMFLHPDKGLWIRKRRYSTAVNQAAVSGSNNNNSGSTWLKSFLDFCL
ncbi:XK-related protein 6 [Hypsibius exemplaris]|uniref:XK-related protein n=1 Tax=Hypsibius exemplaris TaxID=2072580 RepID=A0A1W0X6B7_HYPEX|nr:XK-related protein 6 [Hypsibius exemplaris]